MISLGPFQVHGRFLFICFCNVPSFCKALWVLLGGEGRRRGTEVETDNTDNSGVDTRQSGFCSHHPSQKHLF